jgi:hypothetical protein
MNHTCVVHLHIYVFVYVYLLKTAHILRGSHKEEKVLVFDDLLMGMQAHPEPIMSCLADDRLGMKQAILEIVASKAVSSLDDVKRYTKCTLLAATHDIQVRVIALVHGNSVTVQSLFTVVIVGDW